MLLPLSCLFPDAFVPMRLQVLWRIQHWDRASVCSGCPFTFCPRPDGSAVLQHVRAGSQEGIWILTCWGPCTCGRTQGFFLSGSLLIVTAFSASPGRLAEPTCTPAWTFSEQPSQPSHALASVVNTRSLCPAGEGEVPHETTQVTGTASGADYALTLTLLLPVCGRDRESKMGDPA